MDSGANYSALVYETKPNQSSGDTGINSVHLSVMQEDSASVVISYLTAGYCRGIRLFTNSKGFQSTAI